MEQLRHLGESEERCSTLCGADLDDDHRYSNVEVDPTWSNDGSWIDGVTCLACLSLAVKIGTDATRRLSELRRQVDNGEVELRDPVKEFIAQLDATPQPLSLDAFKRLAREFYELPGNACGGSLHIVLDDQNWERDHVQFCYGYAAGKGDEAGTRFAGALLRLTDEQLRDYCGDPYCRACKHDVDECECQGGPVLA